MHRVNKIVWTLILLAFSLILGILLFGGSVTLYLAPRMINIVYFGFSVFSVLLIYNIVSMFAKKHDEKHKVFKLKNLLFVIPIALFIFTSPDRNTVSALPASNLNLTYFNETEGLKEGQQEHLSDADEIQETTPKVSPAQQSTEATIFPESSYDNDEPDETENSETERNGNQTGDADKEKTYKIVDIADMEPCIIDDKTDVSEVISKDGGGEFTEFIYKDLGQLNGQKATLYGFVYIDESFPEDTIAISRLLITCCVADASLVGVHVKVDDVAKYENDEWIVVSGVVVAGSMEYYGQYYEIPVIKEGTVVKCEAPQGNQEYIYP